MTEFHIRLQYISMQHKDAENAFLFRLFDRCAAETRIFSYTTRSELGGGGQDGVHTHEVFSWSSTHEVSWGGGGQDGVHTHPKIWPKWCLCLQLPPPPMSQDLIGI